MCFKKLEILPQITSVHTIKNVFFLLGYLPCLHFGRLIMIRTIDLNYYRSPLMCKLRPNREIIFNGLYSELFTFSPQFLQFCRNFVNFRTICDVDDVVV